MDNLMKIKKKGMTKWQKALWSCQTNEQREELLNEFMKALGVQKIGTNYEKGVRLEREVVNIFKKAGFEAVRTAGSKSPFDVILWKTTDQNKKICFVAFVQCKVKKV